MFVRVLGQIEASNGDPVALGGPTQRRVFAALVARRGEIVSVPHLVEICWTEDDRPAKAEHNVRTYVHRLRTALGEDGGRIETVNTGYRFRAERDELDIQRFEDLTSAADRRASDGDLAEALVHLDDAEALWLGRPYAEFAHEPWAIAEMARLDELHWLAGERRAEILLASGRPGAAVTILEGMTLDEPLRERPRELLMRALYESGRQAEALRAFQNFRRVLVDEIGVEPSRHLVELDHSIASGELTATPALKRTVGSYELKERIGEGAFAVVHRATQASLGREVAVKVVRAELANRSEFIRRFEAEAQMVAAIEHPNVVPLYDFWREPDQAFLVMRWMHGGSLEQRLDSGPLSLEGTVELVGEIAAALDASHEHGVVHRDVKPANILFDEAGRAFLGDFGIALTYDELASPEAALSEGSPVFAAPEQLRREQVGPEADVHALAIVAFNALTGRTPFSDSANQRVLLRRQLEDPIPELASVRPGLPKGLDRVLQVATAKAASDRYPAASGFAAAFAAAARDEDRPDVEPDVERANPYLGLRAFSETDTAVFHGRSRLIDELVDQLAAPDNNLLAIVGPSGSGKSSVVRAGLIPALRKGRVPGSERWFTTTMSPGAHPFEAFETALLRVAVNPPSSLLDQLRNGERGLLRAATRVLPDDDAVLVVVIDQFEELFTAEVSAPDRDLFLGALAVAATEPLSRVRIVLTLRADFYDEPLRHRTFAPLIKRHTQAITPLAADELEAAITSPAAAVGVRFEPGLVAELIAGFQSEPGALPLLQYTLTELFERRVDERLTLDAYHELGGLNGALAGRADDLYESLDSESRNSIRNLFTRLVNLGEGTEDTRRRMKRSELPLTVEVQKTIDRYVRARLVTIDRDRATREPTLEVAHEALISEWPRLRRWLDEDREDLRTHRLLSAAASTWVGGGHNEEDLYRGGRLEAVEPWLDGERALSDAERNFVLASTTERDRVEAFEQARLVDAQNQNTRLRRLLMAVGVVAAVALTAGVLAFNQRGEAIDAREDAEETARAAETARLVATSATLTDTNPRIAVLLAREAYNREKTVETLGALQTALSSAGPLLWWLGAGEEFTDVEWVDAGVVGASTDSVVLFDWQTGARLDTVVANVGRGLIFGATEEERLAATGTTVAFIDNDSAVQVHDVSTGSFQPVAKLMSEAPFISIAVRPDEQRFVTTDSNGVVTIWNRDGTVVATTDVTDFPNMLEQTRAYFGRLLVPAEDLEAIPVLSMAFAATEEIVVLSAAEVTRLNWAGDVLSGPLTTPEDFLGQDVGAAARFFWSTDEVDVLVSLGSLWTGDIQAPVDELRFDVVEGTGFTAARIVAPVSNSGPLPDLLLDDGTVLRVDPLTLESEIVVDPGLDRTVGAAISPNDDGTIAVANPAGIAIVSLNGGNPLATALPRDPLAVKATISRDGRFAATGRSATYAPTEPSAPMTLWRNNGSFWSPLPPLESEAGLFAAIPSTGVSVLQLGEPPKETLFYDLDGAEPRLIARSTLENATTSDIHGETGRAVRAGFQLWIYDMSIAMRGGMIHTGRLPRPAAATNFDTIWGVRFSPSGDRLLVSMSNGVAEVWDTETWSLMDEPEVELADIALAYWSEDGSLLATASSEGIITIRDGDTYEEIREMVGAVGSTRAWNDGALLFSADNSTLLTNLYGPARLWDVESGNQIGRAFPNSPGTNSGANYGETLQLITGAEEAALIWNLDTSQWPDLACRFAGSNMTEAEWEQFGPRDEPIHDTCPE